MPIRKSKYDILRRLDEPVDQFHVSYNRLTITTDDYGLLIQMRDAALMEDEQLLEFLCPFTKETDYAWEHDWCVENWGTKWDIFDVEIDERPQLMTRLNSPSALHGCRLSRH